MIIKRRHFLQLLGSSAGAAGLAGCNTPWSVPDQLVKLALRGPGLERETQTTCGLCGGGCGVTVRLVDDLPVGLKGNPNHPLNLGGLCPVGQSALDLLYHPDRLQQPLRRNSDGEHAPVSWEDALAEITSQLKNLRAGGNMDRVAFLNGEPGLLFRDLLEHLASTLGTRHVAHQSDLSVLPYRLSQGVDEIPAFDLAGADTVLSFGLDLFEDGPAPLAAVASLIGTRPTGQRCSVLQVGTRLSPSAAKALQFVKIKPETHAAFALGVANVLVREGHYDSTFVADHTHGFEAWTEGNRQYPGFRQLLMERYYPDRVAQICGCEAVQIVQIARRFAQSSFPVAIAGGEAVRACNGTWNVLAAHALNALMGSFDRPGGVFVQPRIPFTPMPTVSEQEPAAPTDPFGSVRQGGLFATDPVQALSEAVLDGQDPLSLLFVMAWNPVREAPAGQSLQQALEKIPFVVVLAPFMDETARQADLVLPTPLFLESWHDFTSPQTIALSTVGLSRPVVESLYQSRHPGDILLNLGQSLFSGNSALPWRDYPDYLKDRLQGLAASGRGSLITGSFEESWKHFLEERGWRFQETREIEEFWDELAEQSGWWGQVLSDQRDWERLFRTSSGRYEFFSHALREELTEFGQALEGEGDSLARACRRLSLAEEGDGVCLPHYEPPRTAGEGDLALVPFRPITARGRLGVYSPMTLEMFGFDLLSGWETWAGLSRDTAERLHLEDGDLAVLRSDRGEIDVVVRILPDATPDTVHVPVGLGHRPGGAVENPVGSNPLAVVQPVQDSLAGTPSWTSTRVTLHLTRRRPHGGPAPAEGGHA